MPLSFLSRLLPAFIAAALFALPALADESDAKAGTLPPALESALSSLLSLAQEGKGDPAPGALTAVFDFLTSDTKTPSKVRPAARPQGTGAYLKETINVPLRTLMAYMLNPAVPGEAIYPSAVRRNAWLPGSPLLKESAAFLGAALPPAAPLISRGVEFEETTPDTSSGCYYSYKLHRLFVLTSYKDRTALLSVSFMPEQSSVGLRGAIVGDDKDWTYVYTPQKGTNLTMLGWAETYLYGSASVSVFMENAPDGKKTDAFFFKWVKAGWKGSNVVKPSHVTAGLKRFTSGLRRVMESPKRPSAQAVAARFAELKGMDDAALRGLLKDFAAHIARQDHDPLDEKTFRAVLDDEAYPGTLKRDDAVAELMKLYVRGHMGSLPVPPAPIEGKDSPQNGCPRL